MKKAICFLLIVALFTATFGMTSCYNEEIEPPKMAPTNEQTVRTVYDDEITIGSSAGESNIFFSLTCNEKQVFRESFSKDDAFYSHYDVQNDLLNNFGDIVSCFEKEGGIRAYRFHWGIIYTSDNGESWKYVLKHQYEATYKFEEIYKSLTCQEAEQ